MISRSTVSIQNATAQKHGGGFAALDEVVIDEMSSVSISTSRSGQQGGGFQTDRSLQVSNSSVLSLENVTAGNHGGAFAAHGEVELAGNSTVKISNSRAEARNGGGFDTENGLKVSNGSRLIIRNATAGIQAEDSMPKARLPSPGPPSAFKMPRPRSMVEALMH